MKEVDNEKNTSRYTGLSAAELRKRRRLMLPPQYVRVGRRILYRRRDIDEFLESCAVRPRSGRDGSVR